MKKTLLVPLVLVVALVALWAGIETRKLNLKNANQSQPTANTSENIDKLLNFVLKTPNGETRALSDWQGKVLVVNFWATWCPPCREEMPEFSRAHDRYAGNGVQFVGIAIDEAANVTEFTKTTKVSYPLLISSAEVLGLTATLGNAQQGLPFTLIIGRDGKLVSNHLGRLSEADLTNRLTPLL